MPSSTVENYLKSVYLLSLGTPKGWVGMGRLAERMNVTPGTATSMVKAFAESGLVHYKPYEGVSLTEEGQKLALLMVRRHRLIEQFLVRIMGLDWSCVDEDAEQLEHAVSDRVIQRMDEMLGFPQFDPHGDAIPTAEGTVATVDASPLSEVKPGQAVRLTRVLDQRPAFLAFLGDNALTPGSTLRLDERNDVTSTVVVRVGERKLPLALAVAEKLMVQPMAEGA